MKRILIVVVMCAFAYVLGHVSEIDAWFRPVKSATVQIDADELQNKLTEIQRMRDSYYQLAKKEQDATRELIKANNKIIEFKNKTVVSEQPVSVLTKDEKALRDTLDSIK